MDPEDLESIAQDESLRYLYAVAPNGLGAVSSTVLVATLIAGLGQMKGQGSNEHSGAARSRRSSACELPHCRREA